MKRRMWLFSALAVLLLVSGSVAWVGNCPTLPASQVVPRFVSPALLNNATFDISFTGIPTTEPYDLVNGQIYPGWCLEQYVQTPSWGSPVTLYCSLTPPSDLSGLPWNKVNYILNHKMVGSTWQDVQEAIWLVVQGYATYLHWQGPSANALLMANEAEAYGGTFVPGPNQLVAVLLYTGDGGLLGRGVGWQETFIELLIPPSQGEGCTPGYWKNHFEDWAAAGYSPSQKMIDVFGTGFFGNTLTLGEAIGLGGGGINRIARHGVAALLSAAHPDVDYPYTVAQVIAYVQAGKVDALVTANELGCFIPERR
jgi:hypothetical protein